MMTQTELSKKFKDLIINNPNLPIKFFVGEEAYSDEFPYNEAKILSVSIRYITKYDDYYLDEEELENVLEEIIDDINEQKNILENAKFEEYICIYLNN